MPAFTFLALLLLGCQERNDTLATRACYPSGALGQTGAGHTLFQRFAPPQGFRRVPPSPGSFAAFLRQADLQPERAPVRLYNGKEKKAQVHAAVLRFDVGERDLQQCADALMRLRAEWLFSRKQYEAIAFPLTNGFPFAYSRWRRGERLSVRGNRSAWTLRTRPDTSYRSFREYLDVLYTYAGTLSLERMLWPRPVQKLSAGDVFIQGGAPGHCVVVMDVAVDAHGRKVFLLAQSYMPAQEIHILKNPTDPALSPWYRLEPGTTVLETPEWQFRLRDLRSWSR